MKTIKDAWNSYLKMWEHSFNFNGRTSLKDYWSVFLINVIATFVLTGIIALPFSMIETMMFDYELERTLLSIIRIPMYAVCCYLLMLIIPMISIEVRRYHDVGKSAKLYIIHIILTPICSIGAILRLITCIKSGEEHMNSYGVTETESSPANVKNALKNIGILFLSSLITLKVLTFLM